MNEKTRTLVISVVAPLVIAGGMLAASITGVALGDGGSLTKAEFLAKAEAICARMNETDSLMQEPDFDIDDLGDLEGLGRRMADFMIAQRDAIVRDMDRLLELGPPEDDAAFIEQNFFTPLRAARDGFDELIDAIGSISSFEDLENLGDGNLEGLAGQFSELEKLGDPTPQLQAYGFRECASD